ncbi:MAG: hypothetical protein OXU20_42245 [Myxococcales bacterium]|nr:hypothetical protein [Myxococcales bacterium]
MVRKYHITGGAAPRPPAKRVIFCDGGVDESYRPGVDLELSHWIPNRTPERYKASTSTEICLRFVSEGGPLADYDLVVNNHVDVDGVLSTFVLLEPELSQLHADTIAGAAVMGDFWGWAERPSQVLCHALALEIAQSRSSDPNVIYEACYARTKAVLCGACDDAWLPALETLQAAVDRIEDGQVLRAELTPRLTHYAIPEELAQRDLSAALAIPAFNRPLSSTALLPPHARARFDSERVQLVSVESANGWYYDLHYPGYTWADTVGLWRPPGVHSKGSSNQHTLKHPPLLEALQGLSASSDVGGAFLVTRELSPFAAVPGRGFPVIAAYLCGNDPAACDVPPDQVGENLARVFVD